MSHKSTLLLVSALLIASPAAADSLSAALASAYDQNPDLAAQRASLRQTDEAVPLALSGGRPTLGTQLSANQAGLDFADNGRTFQAALQFSQSLYQGGRVGTAVSAAENRILAARARLRAAENTVVLNVVTAYADVLRYARTVELNQGQVAVLDRELQQSKDRFDVGDLTRTDVAQSQAALATAQSNLVVAENQLAAARQAYQRVVGRPAVDLEPLPPLPVLPGTEGQASDIAQANSPALLAARFDEAAARYDVKTQEKARLPSVSATANAAYSKYQGGGAGSSFVRQGDFFTQSGTITATVPLYQGGLYGTQIRQAQQRRSQLLETITSVSRQTQESVVNSWNQLRAARAIINANQIAVDANALAAEGVKQENQVGSRTIIELLTAEQTLLTSKVNLASAQRDEQVAAYALLAAAGAAEAVALGVPVNPYDPTANAKRVRAKWGDAGDADPAAQPRPDAERATKSVIIGPVQ